VESRSKSRVLQEVSKGADELVVNFVRLLAEKGRAAEIEDVARELEALAAAEHQVLDVELTTAHALSSEDFGRVIGRIEQGSGRKVQATQKVDPNLIGGIVLQAGSMRLDASVRGRLERLRHDLAQARS
jgi:F-type H+-transporting ATPase subunit delta